MRWLADQLILDKMSFGEMPQTKQNLTLLSLPIYFLKQTNLWKPGVCAPKLFAVVSWCACHSKNTSILAGKAGAYPKGVPYEKGKLLPLPTSLINVPRKTL